jgi:hypothetical protein
MTNAAVDVRQLLAPTTSGREHDVTRALVWMAGSLATGSDFVDLLNRLTTECTHLLDVASAGVLLADEHGVVHVASVE